MIHFLRVFYNLSSYRPLPDTKCDSYSLTESVSEIFRIPKGCVEILNFQILIILLCLDVEGVLTGEQGLKVIWVTLHIEVIELDVSTIEFVWKFVLLKVGCGRSVEITHLEGLVEVGEGGFGGLWKHERDKMLEIKWLPRKESKVCLA